MPKRSSPHWLDRNLFVCPYRFTLCITPKAYNKICRYLKVAKEDRPGFLTTEHSDASAHFFDLVGGKEKAVVVCIAVGDGRSVAQVHSLLVHEAVHIWQNAREIYGEHNPSSELEAYAIQSLSQRLMEEYDRQTVAPRDGQ